MKSTGPILTVTTVLINKSHLPYIHLPYTCPPYPKTLNLKVLNSSSPRQPYILTVTYIHSDNDIARMCSVCNRKTLTYRCKRAAKYCGEGYEGSPLPSIKVEKRSSAIAHALDIEALKAKFGITEEQMSVAKAQLTRPRVSPKLSPT